MNFYLSTKFLQIEIAPNYIYVSKNPKPQSSINCQKRYLQLDLYTKMLETPKFYEGTGRILHLALCGLSRTHCELVVEGNNSRINSRGNGKRSGTKHAKPKIDRP